MHETTRSTVVDAIHHLRVPKHLGGEILDLQSKGICDCDDAVAIGIVSFWVVLDC